MIQYFMNNSIDCLNQKILHNFNKLNGKKVSNFPKEIYIKQKFIDLNNQFPS
jgi:hypothetical protein